MLKLVLASNNKGKLAELRALLAELPVELVAKSDLGIGDAEEPYRTFVENALAKARHASALSGHAAIADDAGLCVDAFDGQPGVDTVDFGARFGHPKGDEGNVRALLEQLGTRTDRGAALVSVLVAVRQPLDPEPLVVTGRVRGVIAFEPIGANGFGFDPVMFLPERGCTFAQLEPADKNRLSHRGQAARQMLALMRERWF